LLVVESGVLYMCWNGATKIITCEFFAGVSGRDLKIVWMLKSREFGTMFKIRGSCEKLLKVSACRGAELIGIRTLWWLLHREEDGGLITSL
jgi:hypothetical protein